MRLALFGRVVVPHAGSLRFPERLHDSLRILFGDPRSQSAHVGSPVDLIIRLGTDLVHRPIGGHENEHDFRRVLLQESHEPPDPGGPAARDRLHEEQDRTASRDDGGLVFRRAARGVVHPEPEGAMFVREPPAVHLRADGRLEFRPACMAGAPGHRPAPSIEPTTVFTADRSRIAASRHPRYSSIMTPARISAVGLTLSIPAYFGALPWTGSNSARASPMFPPAATPSPPIWAAAASLR